MNFNPKVTEITDLYVAYNANKITLGELHDGIADILATERIDELRYHLNEWHLFGDRPPYEGESVSLPILLAYHEDRIDELDKQRENHNDQEN